MMREYIEKVARALRYRLKQVLIAVDQLLNVLLGGWPDETLSSRAWRMRDRVWYWAVARILIDALFFWEEGHCAQAFDSEREGRQLPPELRREG